MNQQVLTNKNTVCSFMFLEPDEATPVYAKHLTSRSLLYFPCPCICYNLIFRSLLYFPYPCICFNLMFRSLLYFPLSPYMLQSHLQFPAIYPMSLYTLHISLVDAVFRISPCVLQFSFLHTCYFLISQYKPCF